MDGATSPIPSHRLNTGMLLDVFAVYTLEFGDALLDGRVSMYPLFLPAGDKVTLRISPDHCARYLFGRMTCHHLFWKRQDAPNIRILGTNHRYAKTHRL